MCGPSRLCSTQTGRACPCDALHEHPSPEAVTAPPLAQEPTRRWHDIVCSTSRMLMAATTRWPAHGTPSHQVMQSLRRTRARHALFGNAATMHTMPQSGRRGWRAVHTSRRRICFPWRSNAPSLPRQTHEHTTVDRCPGITRHLRPRIIRKRTGEVSAPSVRSFPTPRGSASWTRTSRI